MPLSSCEIVKAVNTSPGICEGLALPVDDLANTLIDWHLDTPGPVIVTATKVIKGYDGGCTDG